MARIRIGVDLGGTKIEAVALVEGVIAVRERIATPQGDYDGTIGAIATLIGRVAAEAGGCAGPVRMGVCAVI